MSSIDEGIEVLTGVRAGARQADRAFEEGTVNARADARLKQLADTLVEFGKSEEHREKVLA